MFAVQAQVGVRERVACLDDQVQKEKELQLMAYTDLVRAEGNTAMVNI
jgi:hypothetical protein